MEIPFSTLTDKGKLAMCPRVVLNGWWWKRFIPYYRHMSSVMNALAQYDWMHGGYEKHQEKLRDVMNGFSPDIRNKIDTDIFNTLNIDTILGEDFVYGKSLQSDNSLLEMVAADVVQ